MLKIVSAAVVARAKLGFRTLVQALLRLPDPFGFNACLGGEPFGNIAGKTWPEATKMAGEGMPKPRGRDGENRHASQTRGGYWGFHRTVPTNPGKSSGRDCSKTS
jgi:hypothetical protein